MKTDIFLHTFSTIVGLLTSWRSVRNPRAILIYKFDHFGDVLMATPALRAIRERYPAAHITLVAGEWNRVMLGDNPNVDELVIYNSSRYTRAPYPVHRLRDLRSGLKGRRFDLVIGLRDDWRTLLHALIEPARHIERGRSHLKDWLGRRFGSGVREHEVDRLWETIQPLGIRPRLVERLDYRVAPEERIRADRLMAGSGIGRHFAIIHPGTSHPFKEWNTERFAVVARRIAERYGCQIVVIGSPEESIRAGEVVRHIPDLNPVDLSGRADFRDTAALISQAWLYVGSDGGMMHVAAALEIPTVGLFGPGSHEVFRPVGNHAVVVTHAFACSPCLMTTCIHPESTCMQAITVDEVMSATELLMTDRDIRTP